MKKYLVITICIILMLLILSSKVPYGYNYPLNLDLYSSKGPYEYQLDMDGIYIMNQELILESIDEGVIRINHKFPWDANSLIIEMENSEIVLIDTPYTYEATKEVVEWIRAKVGNERSIVAINTGFHFDNLGGNKYLVEQGIKVHGISQTVDMIHEKGEGSRQLFLEWLKAPNYKKYYDVFVDLEYIEPTEVYQLKKGQEKTLNFGKASMILYYPGESHSPDNIVVYYPEKKLLFGGCMVKDLKSRDLGNIADANLSEWVTSIEKLKLKYDETSIQYIVPGHGDVGDIRLLDKTLELLR